MRDFPQYSQIPFMETVSQGTSTINEDGSLTYSAGALPSAIFCDMLTEDMMTNACKLAKARGKEATLRIGGGEVWDDSYRAVENANYYFRTFFNKSTAIVGGGAGTVSAIGGWMQGNGLGCANDRYDIIYVYPTNIITIQ